MYTNGLKDKYGKQLNRGIQTISATNQSKYIKVQPSISDTSVNLTVSDYQDTDQIFSEISVRHNVLYTHKRQSPTENYDITTEKYVTLDCHEKNGVIMAATASGVVKSHDGLNWQMTSLTLPCACIHGIDKLKWIAGGYPKISGGGCSSSNMTANSNADYVQDNKSTWETTDGGKTWKKISLFSKKGLSPWCITSMPHPENELKRIVLFGCKNNGGLWVRYYNTAIQGYSYKNLSPFTQGNASVVSMFFHEKSKWLFVGVERPIDGYTLWMSKDLKNWLPALQSSTAIRCVAVTNLEDIINLYNYENESSYVYCYDEAKPCAICILLKTLEDKALNNTPSTPEDWTDVDVINQGFDKARRFERAAVISCSNKTQSLVLPHADGVGVVNSSNPFQQKIIFETQKSEVPLSVPYSVCVNHNCKITIGNAFSCVTDSNGNSLPPSKTNYNNSTWDLLPNNKLNSQFGIIDFPIEGTFYTFSDVYHNLLDNALVEKAKTSPTQSYTPTSAKKLSSNGTEVRNFNQAESTFLLTSSTYTSKRNKGSWFEDNWIGNPENIILDGRQHSGFFSIGLQHNSGWDGPYITNGTHPILCATNSNGNRGFITEHFRNDMVLSEWLIGIGIMGGNNSWENVFNTKGGTKERLGLGIVVNADSSKLNVVYNWGTERKFLHPEGIEYHCGGRVFFGVYGGYIYVCAINSNPDVILKIPAQGLDTDLHIGNIETNIGESCIWTNGGITPICQANNRIINITPVKRLNQRFDFLETIKHDHQWWEYDTYDNSIQRSIIGESYNTKKTINNTPSTYNSYFTKPIHNTSNNKWYTSVGIFQTNDSTDNPIGIYSSDDDGSTWTLSNSGVVANEIKFIKNELALIQYDAQNCGTQLNFIDAQDVVTSSSLQNIRHAHYIPSLDAVLVSNGYGNMYDSKALFGIMSYDDFKSGTTNIHSIMKDVDLSTYLPSDFFILRGENDIEYVYCCFYDTDSASYDICRLNVDALKASLNNKLYNDNFFDEFDEQPDGVTDFGLSLSNWEMIATGIKHGWKDNSAIVINDVHEGYSIYNSCGNKIHKIGAYTGNSSVLKINEGVSLGHINNLCCNQDMNTLYACTENGLFLIEDKSSYSTGSDMNKRICNIFRKLGIEQL